LHSFAYSLHSFACYQGTSLTLLVVVVVVVAAAAADCYKILLVPEVVSFPLIPPPQ